MAVVEHDDCRLMIRRGGREWYADGYGSWAHPGGWLDFGESPLRAAVRETEEETSVVVGQPVFVDYTVNFNRERTLWITTLMVRCQYLSGQPRIMETDKILEVAWVPLDEVSGLGLFTPTRAYQNKYVDSLV